MRHAATSGCLQKQRLYHRGEVVNTVDSIGWSEQALAYTMGELKIRELRTRAEQQLGPRFDVRAFRDVVLHNGAIPLDVREATVEE